MFGGFTTWWCLGTMAKMHNVVLKHNVVYPFILARRIPFKLQMKNGFSCIWFWEFCDIDALFWLHSCNASYSHQARNSSWTELNELNGGKYLASVPRTKLNELAANPIRQANWTERTLFKRIWTEFSSLWHHIILRTSKQQAQPAKCIIPPPRRHTPCLVLRFLLEET